MKCTFAIIVLYTYTLIVFMKAQDFEMIDCGSDYNLKNIIVEDCDSTPCPFVLEDLQRISLSYDPTYRVEGVNEEVYIECFDIRNEVLNPRPNPCDFYPCDLRPEHNASFMVTKPILNFPQVPCTMHWEWTDSKNSDRRLLCFEIGVVICRPGYC